MVPIPNTRTDPDSRDEEWSGILDEAIERVKNANSQFAYIGDATEIRYAAETDSSCSLEAVGTELSRQPYAIRLQQGDPLQRQITTEILSMGTKFVLSQLSDAWREQRWW